MNDLYINDNLMNKGYNNNNTTDISACRYW